MNRTLLFIFGFACLILLCVPPSPAFSRDPQPTYKDLNDYRNKNKRRFPIKKTKDLNKDSVNDFILYDTYGEEHLYHILLSQKDRYIDILVPVGEEYKFLEKEYELVIEVAVGTYPAYDSVVGPDKFYWYDYYQVRGQKLEKINEDFPEVYRKIIPQYKERISEIEKDIAQLPITLKHIPPDQLDTFEMFRRMQIKKYVEFIKNAEKIVNKSPK